MSSREKIEQIVLSAITELNRHRQSQEQLATGPQTLLLGSGAALDSLGFVTLAVDLEEKVQREFGKEPQLVATLMEKGGAVSIGSLVELIDSLVHEK